MSVIPRIRQQQNLFPGMRYTSIPFTTTGLVAGTPVNIFKGFGYGFIVLHANNSAFSPTLKIRVRGIGNTGNDYMYITPNVWYDGPFLGLQAEANDQLASGQSDAGSWVCNVALQYDARAFPSTPDSGLSGFPAQIGGAPPLLEVLTTTISSDGVAPTLSSQGTSLGYYGPPESLVQVFVTGVGNGGSLIGGGIDIFLWHGDLITSFWGLLYENLPLPTGYNVSNTIAMPIGCRANYNSATGVGDRIYATPSLANPIQWTNGTATQLTMRLQ